MSNNIVGTWSPAELCLPNIEDVDYAMYYVTEAGKIEGLKINFEIGDWLVYLKDRDGKGDWYKANGINVFNTKTNRTAPLPGFYTRVQLDNNANIIGAEKNLNPEDLPPHTHTLSDIETDTDEFKDIIKDITSEMLAGKPDDSVDLKYDKQTKTFSANTKVDDITIGKNADGELYVKNIPSDSSNISFGNIENITSQIEELQEAQQQLNSEIGALNKKIDDKSIIVNSTSGMEAEKLSDGNTLLSVKFDNSSIRLNALGELEVNTDIIGGSGEGGGSGDCANHDHTSDQITDFREAVLKILKENSALDVEKIPIDNETIIINSDGNLSAITSGIGPHTHNMKDITDLDPNKADTWASDQPIKGDSNIDFSNGIFDLSSNTVGGSIQVLNENLKKIDIRLTEAEEKAGTLEPAKPPYIENVSLTPEYIDPKSVWSIKDKKAIVAGKKVVITSGLIYPADDGIISVMVDGQEMDNLVLGNKSNSDISINEQKGSLKVIEIKDYYYNIPLLQGTYTAAIIQYTSTDGLTPGPHRITFKQTIDEPVPGEVAYKRKEITCKNAVSVDIYGDYSPVFEENKKSNIWIDATDDYLSGIPILRSESKQIKGYICISNNTEGSYLPIDSLYFTWGSGENRIKKYVKPSKVEDNLIYYDIVEDIIKKDDRLDSPINFHALSITGKESSWLRNFQPFIFDDTEVNENFYRYTTGEDTQNPPSLIQMSNYKSTEEISNIELIIRDNIAKFSNLNYSNIDGPDYSNNTQDGGFSWITFGFRTKFRSNLFMDIVDKNGVPYKLNREGTLQNIKIFVGQSNQNEIPQPAVWVDGNNPYEGWGAVNLSDILWAGLDLFKSTNIRRYVTFGQGPNLKGGFLFVRIGIPADRTINCKILLDSILESLNG